MASSFQIYSDKKGEFRWRLRAGNGKIIATSGEGYKAKADCEHGINLVKTEGAVAPTADDTASTPVARSEVAAR
ncbi:DUF1508 domain-containing protein [Isosphaeraceae bacterium EP7]